MLHVICTRLRPGHLSVRVGDGSRRNEEIVTILDVVPLNAIVIIIIIIIIIIIDVADETGHLTHLQYSDTGQTSPSADPIMPGAWQGSH